MDDYCSAHDILHPETVCSHRHPGAALLHQKGRQITSVPGMGSAIGIIVVARLRKARSGAAVPFMNVKTEETCFTVFWKTGNIRFHAHTARFLIEPNLTIYIRRVRSAFDISHRIRAAGVRFQEVQRRQILCCAFFFNQVTQPAGTAVFGPQRPRVALDRLGSSDAQPVGEAAYKPF